jgi:uncharacterized membrane protein
MVVVIGLLVSIIGFFIAWYIYEKQHAKKPLMCPRNAPCETVLNSAQATTFGFSNSALGMVFYAIAFFFLFCLYLGGGSAIVEILLTVLTAGGFVFSLYLVNIQRTVIKQWCVWCIGSAFMATILFVVSLFILL